MKSHLLIVLLAVAGLGVTGYLALKGDGACNNVVVSPKPAESSFSGASTLPPLERRERPAFRIDSRLVADVNRAAAQLLSQLCSENRRNNVFIGSYSVYMALAMLLNGAEGGSERQLHSFLHSDTMSTEQLNKAIAPTLDALNGYFEGADLVLSNSIWVDSRYSIPAAFAGTMKDVFRAEHASLRLSTPEAVDRINAWANRNTRGRIPELFPAPVPNLLLLLANACYAKLEWVDKFDPADTEEDDFKLEGGGTKPVWMMQGEKDVFCRELPGLSAVTMPCKEGFSVLLALPYGELSAAAEDPDLIESMLIPENRFGPDTTILQIPRFELNEDYELKQCLSSLGLGALFKNSDFRKMGMPISVSDVVHKTFLKVDEEGAEAAAVTGVDFIGCSSDEPPVFRVDRPFIIAIIDDSSGLVLFVGAIYDPSRSN